jgi:hypothetical protein
MKLIHRVATAVVGTLAITALTLPSASGAGAAPKGRVTDIGSKAWAAPWAVDASSGTCTTSRCATPDGAVQASVGPVEAGWGDGRETASVVFTDVVSIRESVTSRTYTATVVLHDATTSGFGYALLDAHMVSAPGACMSECHARAQLEVASGDSSVPGDVTMNVTFTLSPYEWGAYRAALPAGTYTFGVGVVAGVQEEGLHQPFQTTPQAELLNSLVGVRAGVGSASISATLQRVVRQ